MSIHFPKFVGRDEQLSDIKEQIARQDQTVVVNIAGAGGVGKTTLLRQIKQEYKPPPDTLKRNQLVTDIIDFSHTVHRVESWVLEQITAVKPEGFSTFHDKIRDIETLEPLARLYREREALDAFVWDYNLIASDHRLILLFDTIELVQETPLLEFILELAAKLTNTVLILAGRYNDDTRLIERLNADFGAGRVLTFRLGGFTEEEARLYFEQTIMPHLKKVHSNLRQNIYVLSDGNPIKIALALDWLDKGIPVMPEITHMQPADLEGTPSEALAKLRADFEYALMDGVRQLKSPVDEVILYMAHLHKRFNRQMLEFFFLEDLDHPVRMQQATVLIRQLRELPFVKYMNDDYFVLHDEMARLVQQQVWDLAEDPDKTLRRELSEKACNYYEKELATFPALAYCTEQQRITFWSYRVEQMYYNLYADFRSGYDEFEQLFEQLVGDQRPELAALAISFLREFEGEAEFSDLLACFVDGYYDGGVLLSQQKFGEAEKTLTLGEKQLNEIISKLDLAQASPLDRHLYERRYTVYHQLGFCYRSLGDWEQAIQNYKNSLDLALESTQKLDEQSPLSSNRKKSLLTQIAETLNSLANVYRLVGNFHEARLLGQTSILLRQSWEPDQMAKSQYVMAMILWEMGNTTEAMRYLREAEQSCLPEDESTQALIKKYRGYILFRAGLPHLAMPLLQEADSVFRRRGQFSELADVLNLRSRIYRDHPDIVKDILADRDHMVVAKQYADEAYDIAGRTGDEFRQAECHLTRALLYYRWSHLEPDKGQDHRQKALEAHEAGLKLAEGKHYRLLSLYSGLRGDIAFDQGEYVLAFKQYAQQCAQATHFKRAVYERAIDNIGGQLRMLGAKDTGLVKRYANGIIKFWCQEEQLDVQYPELVDEINEIKKAIEERVQLEKLDRQYQRAFLQGQWRQAVDCCDRLLEISSLYTDVNRANVILDKIRALHRRGDLSEARRLAKVALQIGEELDNLTLIGNAHLWLASVFWDATNTAEAAAHLVQAKEAFERSGDEIGLTRVRRLRSYIRHRTGFFQEPMDELAECVQVFRQNELDSELADVWNVMSRMARTDPQNPEYDQAREYAEWALQRAQSANDSYRIAECYLSLAILAQREQDYGHVLRLCETGLNQLSPETHLLHSVYQGVRGTALFAMGTTADSQLRNQYWDQAFEAFVLELIEATKSKPARLVRTLDLIYKILVHLPAEALQKYTRQIEDAWQREQLDQGFPIVMRMCEEAIRYRPYIQIDTDEREI